MNFLEIARQRQSCRSYDENRSVEPEKLEAILEAARLAPSACNGQPYHLTVCRGEAAQAVAKATMGMGMNNGMQGGMMNNGMQQGGMMNNQMQGNMPNQAAGGAKPKFCPNCGTPTGDSNFCPNCGNKLV